MPYGLIASKLNTTNIFDGCLNVLRNELTSKLPDGKNWTEEIGIKGIVGSIEEHNQHPTPWHEKSPTWIEIYIGNKWILPSAYSLMGRRVFDVGFLKGWNFFGLNRNNDWILLHNESNKQFEKYEIRTYLLKGCEPYKGFKIEMTEPNSEGCWALCLGQIDVFGNIYRSIYIPNNGVFKCTMKHLQSNFLIILTHFIMR